MKHIFVGKWIPGMKHFLEYKLRSEVDETARRRLKWLDHYFSHGENISFTCRHFGIARNTLYRWLEYYEPGALGSLKNHSTRPKVFRKRTVRPKIWNRVCELRMKYPAWGKEKLWVYLKREGYREKRAARNSPENNQSFVSAFS